MLQEMGASSGLMERVCIGCGSGEKDIRINFRKTGDGMERYPIEQIVSEIRKDFTKSYPAASDFADTLLFEHCMEIIGNVFYLRIMVEGNDHGIPPAGIFLGMYAGGGFGAKELTDRDKRCVGALMAFLFKDILGYKGPQDNVPVKGPSPIGTAALYDEKEEFEIYGDAIENDHSLQRG